MKKLSAILVGLLISSTVFAESICKPYLRVFSISGSQMTYTKACVPGSESIFSMTATANGNSVSLDSETFCQPGLDVKKVKESISMRLAFGLSLRDSIIVANQINPALQMGDLEKAKLGLIELILAAD
jgi:hypothetical protein